MKLSQPPRQDNKKGKKIRSRMFSSCLAQRRKLIKNPTSSSSNLLIPKLNGKISEMVSSFVI